MLRAISTLIVLTALAAGGATQEAAPAATLLLRDLNPDEPIPVGDLNTAYFAWKNQPVVVGGFLDVPTRRDRINARISLTSEPGGAISMTGCAVENPSGERVQSDQPLVLKGMLTHFTTATPDDRSKLVLEACEVISIGEAFDPTTPANPGVVNCDMPGKNVVPDSVAANREGIIMRGTIGQPTWTTVVLEDCVFVNRR